MKTGSAEVRNERLTISSDLSNGYESISAEWLATRGNSRNRSTAIGVTEVRTWAKTLPHGSSVLDLGCGPGLPLAAVLIEEGLEVFGVDAAPSFVAAFEQNLPGTPVVCESVLGSSFSDRKLMLSCRSGSYSYSTLKSSAV